MRSLTAHQLWSWIGETALPAPVYRELADRIRLLVVDGRIAPGSRLPGERELASVSRLSRTTVVGAYQRLRDLRLVTSRQGSGSFVSAPTEIAQSSYLPGAVSPADGQIGLGIAAGSAPPGVAAAFERAAVRLPSLLAGPGYLPDGLLELRERIAERFRLRGLPTDADQILVTPGAQAGLAVVSRLLLRPGDRVLVESPSYPNALAGLRRQGVTLCPVPVTAEAGWDLDQLRHVLAESQPTLAYLIADFHNPTGAILPAAQRPEVVELLRAAGTRLVVDETLVELDLDGVGPLPPMARRAPQAITLGSAGKAFWGGLRVGWIRAPRRLVRALIETRVTLDLGVAPFEQLVSAELFDDADAVLKAQRHRLTVQRDHLLGELARQLPEWSLPPRPPGGLSLWATLPAELSSRLAAAAPAHGLVLTAGPQFYPGPGGERRLRLPYASPPDVLTDAMRRLAETWADVSAEADRPSRAGAGRLPLSA